MIRYRVKLSVENILTVEVHNSRKYKILKEGSQVTVSIDPKGVTTIKR